MLQLVKKLADTHDLPDRDLKTLLENDDSAISAALNKAAAELRDSIFGRNVFIRGLIEFSSYCKNNCLYCGLRRGNHLAQRYRLTDEEILECCHDGYNAGFRTFVLQGGEDGYYTRDRVCALARKIKAEFPDCALTLSIGERSKDDYQAFFDAGADRFLLRHETSDPHHYSLLHPAELTLENRISCLRALKSIGFQTGCGMMVGSPGQTTDMLVKDLRFIKDFQPEMVGLGPFIPHAQTPFADKNAGSVDMTLKLLSIVRLMNPNVLLPATTALFTLDTDGRINGINAGANVVMLNLSPQEARKKYSLYDGKADCPDDARLMFSDFSSLLEKNGYQALVSRGDFPGKEPTI